MVEYQNPKDSYGWQNFQSNFEKKIEAWCQKNNMDFFGTYQSLQMPKSEKSIKSMIAELSVDLDFLLELDFQLKNTGKRLFYLTDNLIDANQINQLTNITIIPIPELLGMKDIVDSIEKSSPSKLFNCFIQRVESIRQSWFYFLKHYDLLDKGYVSFLLFQYEFYSDKTGLELFDWIHTHYELNKLPHFEQAYRELRPYVPFSNLKDSTYLDVNIKDSKYSLILETYAIDDNHWAACITEKTIRSLQIPSINLIFSQQYSLSKLANLGFKIDPVMLEIDQLSSIERQQKILEILVNDSIAFDADLLYNNALHNRNLLASYKKRLAEDGFLDKMLNKIYEF